VEVNATPNVCYCLTESIITAQHQANRETMSEEKPNPRTDLLRKTLVLQCKLVVDGMRDALLIPLSLIAAAIGLARGGDNADAEFRRVIKLGRRSERWINLFGHEAPSRKNYPGSSLDTLLDRVEEVVVDQYRKGQSEAEARAAIREVLAEDPAPAAHLEKGTAQ
jgi:hypothetical protein